MTVVVLLSPLIINIQPLAVPQPLVLHLQTFQLRRAAIATVSAVVKGRHLKGKRPPSRMLSINKVGKWLGWTALLVLEK